MAKIRYFICLVMIHLSLAGCGSGHPTLYPQMSGDQNGEAHGIITGAMQPEIYLPLLRGKRVGVIANQTSLAAGSHIVDILTEEKIEIKRVFAPEHGFRGEAGPGERIEGGRDPRTGLPVVSLYGKKKRPEPEDINDLDILVFDIQDVGARFYTYISTLHYTMEACAENGVAMIVLDRPNPNGFYIDGPVLDTAFSSFVGVAPIPVVHGLTVGEYAKMVNGEGWLRGEKPCELTVITMKNYRHNLEYHLPVRPSPNLPNMESIYLYPSLCFFEGTPVSVGRGTPYPFMVYGFPGFRDGTLLLTPEDIPGVITNPPHRGKECSMADLRNGSAIILKEKRLMLEWIIEMYMAFPDKENFFHPFFDTLSGTDRLRKMIVAGNSAAEIRASWKEELERYSLIRSKYLLYD